MSSDHVHMLISVPPHLSISKIVQYVKGKSSREVQGEFQELRKRYWGQHLWARGYFDVKHENETLKEKLNKLQIRTAIFLDI